MSGKILLQGDKRPRSWAKDRIEKSGFRLRTPENRQSSRRAFTGVSPLAQPIPATRPGAGQAIAPGRKTGFIYLNPRSNSPMNPPGLLSFFNPKNRKKMTGRHPKKKNKLLYKLLVFKILKTSNSMDTWIWIFIFQNPNIIWSPTFGPKNSFFHSSRNSHGQTGSHSPKTAL